MSILLTELKDKLFTINKKNFDLMALSLFEYQFKTCDIYNEFCLYLKRNPKNTKKINEIPFLPIDFFKTHNIQSGKWTPKTTFLSSGTNGIRSSHLIKDLELYLETSYFNFQNSVSSIDEKLIIALLPSYLENGDSSLIAMVDNLIKRGIKGSGYYLDKEINEEIINDNTIIFGVSYSLLDLVERFKTDKKITIIDTGGMKGKRKEIIRDEFIFKLKKSFPNSNIISEYGMTELLSQGYNLGNGFTLPRWAKSVIREINDPFSKPKKNKTGGINIIDLANMHTCSFIETKDLGYSSNPGFQIVGRFDNSDIRGCNLLL